MPERFSRLAALALGIILIVAIPLLVSLFGGLNTPGGTPSPTVPIAAAPSPSSTLQATSTPTRTDPVPPPSATTAPSLTPLPSPTAGCPSPATPEPLWVDPVLSPTNAPSQKISVTLGRGREITVSD